MVRAMSAYVLTPFFSIIFVTSHMYPENPEGTRVNVASMNMEHGTMLMYDTA